MLYIPCYVKFKPYFTQKLSFDANDSRSKLEALNRSLEEGILGNSRDRSDTMNRQISELGKRWDTLQCRVQSKLDDNKRVVERRDKFERNFSKLHNLLLLIDKERDSWRQGRDAFEGKNDFAIMVCSFITTGCFITTGITFIHHYHRH